MSSTSLTTSANWQSACSSCLHCCSVMDGKWCAVPISAVGKKCQGDCTPGPALTDHLISCTVLRSRLCSLIQQFLIPMASHGNTATCILVCSFLSFTDNLRNASLIFFNVKEVNCLLVCESVSHDVEVNWTLLRLTSSLTVVVSYNLSWTSALESAR